MAATYSRFELVRPDYLADEYWDSIESEAKRLDRSLAVGDDRQALGDAKCLVEAVAKVTLDINGTPAGPRDPLPKLVTAAHEVLRGQPGRELAREGAYAQVALQASKMAAKIAEIRNAYGGGHGRARQPHVRGEMVDLALDGAFTWVRWVLRRLGLFAEGRPAPLIDALVGSRAIFYGGELARRLAAADLPNIEERHQRSLGVAVGQRSAGDTFVVTADGVRPAMDSPDLLAWPAQYRVGLAYGLLFDPEEQPTIRPATLERAVQVLAPVPGAAGEVADLVDRVIEQYEPSDESDGPSLLEVADRIHRLTGTFAPDLQPEIERLWTLLLAGTT